jgi:cytochrome c peroxidase
MRRRTVHALAGTIASIATGFAAAPTLAHFGPAPISLKGAPVPEVPGLGDGPAPIVVDEEKAIALGKALFWDVNVGSDGIACASCHFHAGADRRVRNQLAPQGQDPLVDDPSFDPSPSGEPRGPNLRLDHDDFPYHQTDSPLSPLGNVIRSSEDVVSSSGTFGGEFEGVFHEAASSDACDRAPDPTFHVAGTGTRLVEPRNAPTVINAVFNFRNLWDGAANNVFNGSSPWGERDPVAGVWVQTGPGSVEKQRLHLVNSSLASQALSPPLSAVEMGCRQRTFADIGRKLAGRPPLETQEVHWQDGVLGAYAQSTPGELRKGLATTYETLVTQAFAPRYWSYAGRGEFGAPPAGSPDPLPYTQYEANFAMFFALAIQLYQGTLISDDSPFDRSATDSAGVPIDLSDSAQRGFTAFRVAHCGLCHIGPVLTPAAVVTNAILVESNPQAFGNDTFAISTTRNVVTRTSLAGGPAFIDTGFASTGVTPAEWDPGLGGRDAFGFPLSFADQYLSWLAGIPEDVVDPFVDEVRACDLDLPIAQNVATAHPVFFTQVQGIVPQLQDTQDCFVPAGAFLPTPGAAAAELASPSNTRMRSAAVGSFKIPTLRNVELTGPYMHNGGMATLDQVIEFYTRGGNFQPDAKHVGTVFPQAQLRFDAGTRADIVAFLRSLTDDRVRFERAPFDHPELRVPHGHVGDHTLAQPGHPLEATLARDQFLVLPAVGAGGRSDPLQPFEVHLVPEPALATPVALATLAALSAWRRRGRAGSGEGAQPVAGRRRAPPPPASNCGARAATACRNPVLSSGEIRMRLAP